ncbi:MAG: LPS biosynthesis protein, partial [Legionella sp. 21-45-4]
ANVTLGQLRYFKDRNVQLCYQVDGLCTDSPLILGYLSPTAVTSPIASSATVHLNSIWSTQASWVWDTATRATNNTAINFEYQPELNHILRLGYSYLVSGNVLDGANRPGINTPLHQATVGGAWPLNPHWSLMGIYSYNVSEQYDMISFLGAQYDSCCWAFRLLGGRVFDSLSPNTIKPHYNNNAYVQIVLKGLGSAGNSDSSSIIQSYLPGYVNPF